MADRFPSLEDFSEGQTEVAEAPTATDDDFLARERAALGEDADQFATAQDHVGEDVGGDDLLGGDEPVEEIGQFESSFPSVETQNQNERVAPGGTITGTGSPFPRTGYSNPQEPEDEGDAVREWREKRDAEITRRAQVSAEKKEATVNPPTESCGDTNISHWSFCSPKLIVYILVTCVILLILFQIQCLDSPGSPSSSSPSWPLNHSWNAGSQESPNCSHELLALAEKLSDAVTFLPLKDLRYAQTAHQGHTWFMSSLYDTHVEGEVQYQQYPSAASRGRLLCIKGRDTHDGARNSYALAWPNALPRNATVLTGLTFVSYNHYNYDNIWHGLSAMVPFVAWHLRDGQCAVPARWVLYHWGELRIKMGPWVKSLMQATFGGSVNIEEFGDSGDGVACFEEAVVTRHNEGGMSRERRLEVYSMMRCKAREYCNVRIEGRGLTVIGLTMLMRTGARSFRNESAVVGIFQRECGKIEGCRLTVAYSDNLTFCQQVKLMSLTDILVSPHGAQLTNTFLMDKNSSVMEFFPKGWLKLAGVGQYVYHWIASWSRMKHEGAWLDPNGDDCPYPEDDHRCMPIYKNGRIGYNDTFFEEWARNVLMKVKTRKMEEALNKNTTLVLSGCACS